MSRRGVRGFVPHVLVEARKAKGLTLGDLGRLVDVSHATLYAWETGTRLPQVDSLARTAEALGLSMRDLIDIPVSERSLVDLRNLAGLTQGYVAEQLGISAVALSKIERAQARLSPERARALADVLDVSVSEIGAGWDVARQRPPGALP